MSELSLRFMQIHITPQKGATFLGIELIEHFKKFEFLSLIELIDDGMHCFVKADYEDSSVLNNKFKSFQLLKKIEEKEAEKPKIVAAALAKEEGEKKRLAKEKQEAEVAKKEAETARKEAEAKRKEAEKKMSKAENKEADSHYHGIKDSAQFSSCLDELMVRVADSHRRRIRNWARFSSCLD